MLGGGRASAAATASVRRVVRCPNCDKLLHQPAGLALYRCGGCGATLQGGDGGRRRPSKAPTVCPATSSEERVNAELAAELQRKRGRALSPLTGGGGGWPAVCADEGPSNYYNPDGHVDEDRVELLRKLDALRDQLRRSCEVAGNPIEEAPVNKLLADRIGRQSRFLNGPEMDRPSFYPTMHHQPSFHPAMQQFNGFVPHHDDFYNHDGFYRQPSCSCLHCYNTHWLPPVQAPPPVRGSYLVDVPPWTPQGFHQRLSSSSVHQRAAFTKEERSCRPVVGGAPFIMCHNCLKLLQIPEAGFLKGKNRQKLRCGSCSQVMLLEFDGLRRLAAVPAAISDTASENNAGPDGGVKGNLQPSDHADQCHVLPYSEEFDSSRYEVDGRRKRSGVSASATHTAIQNNVGSDGGVKDNLQFDDHANLPSILPYSEDFDSTSSDIHSTIDKLILPSPSPLSSLEKVEKGYGLNPSQSEKMQELSFSSRKSENSESLDIMICQREPPSSAELPFDTGATLRVSGSPLHEYLGYPPSNQKIERSGKGRSKCSEQEMIGSLDANSMKNYVKDVPLATEVDFSSVENPNRDFSHKSWEADEDEGERKVSKGGESFFAGIIKKSFKDCPRLNQEMESGRCEVSINGHPITDCIVKKAEKQAGPIDPGEYWYDFRAGFWGVMGDQCLGIIPPFIEEFNYPMPKNCSDGNTGVLVNGRELHQKDLDLLVGRGLPSTDGHSYIIEISGEVWDEASGEELNGLGKLAPTIEKMKQGFGMRVPGIGA